MKPFKETYRGKEQRQDFQLKRSQEEKVTFRTRGGDLGTLVEEKKDINEEGDIDN